jgi:uncharacterized protein
MGHMEFTLSGFIVGLLVGLTGVGGGSLMTPLLVIIFKINPAIAIGTDLLYASITKSAGILSHGKMGHIDWKIVRKLMMGSIPSSLVVTYYLKEIDLSSPITLHWIEVGLGVALIITSMALTIQPWIIKKTAEKRIKGARNTTLLTIGLGAVLGAMVTLTSVGAGALGVTALLLLYPRMKITHIIGTDIAHAVPLTLFAGLGHYNLGNVDLTLLGALLLGSIPGIWIGSYLSAKIDENKLRYILVIILLLVGLQLILNK